MVSNFDSRQKQWNVCNLNSCYDLNERRTLWECSHLYWHKGRLSLFNNSALFVSAPFYDRGGGQAPFSFFLSLRKKKRREANDRWSALTLLALSISLSSSHSYAMRWNWDAVAEGREREREQPPSLKRECLLKGAHRMRREAKDFMEHGFNIRML